MPGKRFLGRELENARLVEVQGLANLEVVRQLWRYHEKIGMWLNPLPYEPAPSKTMCPLTKRSESAVLSAI